MHRLLVIVSSLALGAVLLASPASANLPGTGGTSGPCAGANMSHVVKRYYGVAWGNGTVPLRCGRWDGTSGWGYRKLVAKGRWNIWYDGMIAVTMATPTLVTHFGSSTRFYSRWFTNCSPVYRFVVIVEARLTPQGVVSGVNNAYRELEE